MTSKVSRPPFISSKPISASDFNWCGLMFADMVFDDDAKLFGLFARYAEEEEELKN